MNPNPTNISQKDFELIDRYINNDLSENEKIDFENRLNSDSKFKQHFKEQLLLSQAIEEQVLTGKLNEFHKEATTKVISINNNSSFYRKLAVAASIAILIGIGGFLFLNKPTNNEKVFATYFKPDPGLATTMGTTTQFEFLDAMVDYKQGNYAKAIKKWEPILKYNPTNDSLNYFIGVAYLADENEKSAIKHLIPVTKNSNSVFVKDAYFYLGLAYLKSGNLELAKKNLIFSEENVGKQIIADLEN